MLMGMPVLAGDAFPDKPGKKTVERLCGSCHGLNLFANMRKTRQAWHTSVHDMVSRGMNAEDSELEEMVEYLSRYLSRLNVNKAQAAELADVLGLTAKEGEAIVAHRAKAGEFKSFDELSKVPGVDAKKLAEQRDRIGFSGQ
jgi:competence protein ComEA